MLLLDLEREVQTLETEPDGNSQTLETDPDGIFLDQFQDFLATGDTIDHLARALNDRHVLSDRAKAAIANAAQPLHPTLKGGACHRAVSKPPRTPKSSLRLDAFERSRRISHPCEAPARLSENNGDLSPQPEPEEPEMTQAWHGELQQPNMTQAWHGTWDEWYGDQDDTSISEKSPSKDASRAKSSSSDRHVPRASAQLQGRASEQAASEPNTARSVVLAALPLCSRQSSEGASTIQALQKSREAPIEHGQSYQSPPTTEACEGAWNDLPSPIMADRPHAEYARDLRPRIQVTLNSHRSNASLSGRLGDIETNPYVRALRAHREEIRRAAVDLESLDDTADSLASRLATQRHDSLASLTHEVSSEQHLDHTFARCGTETRCGPEPCYERGHSEIEVVCGPREGYPRLLRTPRTTDEPLNSARSYLDPRDIAEGRGTNRRMRGI